MERKGLTRAGALPAVVAAVAMAAAVPVAAQSTGLKSVRDPQNRFTINVPAAWTVTTQSKNPAVEAKSPAPGAAGGATMLPDSLDVTVYDWRMPISAHDCISESDIVLRYVIHAWTTVRESSATVGGQPAYSRVYNWKAGNGEPRQSVETCVTHGNRVFVAVGTTNNTPARVNATMPLLERAIATLEPNFSVVPTPQPTTPGSKN